MRLLSFFRLIRRNISPFSIFYFPVNLVFWGQSIRVNYMVRIYIWGLDYVVHHKIFHLFINFILLKRGDLYYLVFMALSSVVTILCTVTSVSPKGSSANRNRLLYLLMILFTWIASSLLRWFKRKNSHRERFRALNIISRHDINCTHLDIFIARIEIFRMTSRDVI